MSYLFSSQFSTISLIENEIVISEDSKLAKTFNTYFDKTMIELEIKEYKNFDIRIPTLDPRIMSILLLINTKTIQVSK